MKKFKPKKKRRILKILIYLSIIVGTFYYSINNIFNIKLKSSNEEFIKLLLNDFNYSEKYNKTNILKKVFNVNPSNILSKTLYYKKKKTNNIVTKYIENPDKEKVDNPRVYIYNTHQLEDYDLENYSEYNITPNVLMASYLLKGLLNKENINTVVEESNINDFLSLNGWDYSNSYKASRYFIEDFIKKNPNLDLIIDLHRDSIPKEKSTVNIDGKNFAKILFVVGTDYDTYSENLNLANTLNEIIKQKYPSLTRGVIEKGGRGVNGVYNQDLNNKMVLIECGSNNNTIDEVMNTIIVIKDAIKEYLGE